VSEEWITAGSVGSFAVATSITTAVSNGIQRAFNFNPAWLALAVAEILCLAITFLVTPPPGGEATPSIALRLFLSVVNGFFVFAASAGVTQIGGTVGGAQGRAEATAAITTARRRFWSSWF
jgi:hypothetical protein